MGEPIGGFCLVLHGHLPYVLHHGSWPHGEAWLYEAAAETYLPLLDLIGEIALLGVHPAITLGLTPVLIEQLASERFQTRFVAYLHDRMNRAREDERGFESRANALSASVARMWQSFYSQRLEQFERIGRDIPGQFAQRCREGHIQILGGPATHPYLPLLRRDESIRAQFLAGAAVTQRQLGVTPRGIWLPECGYRPQTDAWQPAVLDDQPRHRDGLESFVADIGATHFFVDSPLIVGGHPIGTMEGGRVIPATLDPQKDRLHGWREPMEAVGINSPPGRPDVWALARHPRVGEQVWSDKFGYPGDEAYLEFHRRHGDAGEAMRGLRYWKVTDVAVGLEKKEAYDPAAVAGKVYGHAQHFCSIVREVLADYTARTGRTGVVVAAFDAELFGHWWFEGPRFLKDVILTLNSGGHVQRMTAEASLSQYPPQKVMRLNEGSWGKHGNHQVWLNDQTRWMWEVEYRAESHLQTLLKLLPWQTKPAVAECLRRAARELLLLQASDWPFVVSNGAAVDYGTQRHSLHAVRFQRACDIAEHLAAGGSIGEVQRAQIEEMDAHDGGVFEDIDLRWWQR